MKNKAVILGANYYIGLSAIRCLGRQGITVAAVDYQIEGTYGFKSKYLSEKLIAPHYRTNEKEFIDFLIDYAKKQELKPVLFPCADPYVEVIDKYLDTLKKYYLISQKKQGLFTEVMDKNSLQTLAIKHNVLVPETIRINEDNFYEKINTIISYPCIVKPSDSPSFVRVFRKKMFKVHNQSELDEAIFKANENNLEVFVQKIIEGFDDHMYTFDTHLNQNSKVTHYMTCRKFRQYPINFGASVYTGQIHEPEIVTIGTKFLEDIGYKGFAEIEFKKDKNTGEFYLIEINVRTTNLNCLLEKVGINFPYIAYSELIGENIGTNFIQESSNIFFRYTYEDILAIKGYLKTKQLSIFNIISSLFRKKSFSIFSLDDPSPYFSFMSIFVGKIFKKIFK